MAELSDRVNQAGNNANAEKTIPDMFFNQLDLELLSSFEQCGFNLFDSNCAYKDSQVVLIGEVHEAYNKEISFFLRKHLEKGDLIMLEGCDSDENLDWVLRRFNDEKESRLYSIGNLDLNINVCGVEKSELYEYGLKLIKKSLFYDKILASDKISFREQDELRGLKEKMMSIISKVVDKRDYVMAEEIIKKFSVPLVKKIKRKAYVIAGLNHVRRGVINKKLDEARINYSVLEPIEQKAHSLDIFNYYCDQDLEIRHCPISSVEILLPKGKTELLDPLLLGEHFVNFNTNILPDLEPGKRLMFIGNDDKSLMRHYKKKGLKVGVEYLVTYIDYQTMCRID